MKVQAEISVYPLKTTELSGPVDEFCRTIQAQGYEVKMGQMSCYVSGECKDLFKAVQEAFEKLTEKYQVVMVTKISNACPQINND
jgi:uncharacterized protein YqgV (UPF0045/DUF77 family)